VTPKDKHINYIEFKTNNIETTKKFYSFCFDWEFTDYGPNYTSFENSGLAGGFELTKEKIQIGVLVVIIHQDLHKIKSTIIKSGGIITKDIFSFPGGERFQFKDPTGNELAVWREL
jgi:predicted enzyme related to lactoylglutathione lyase